MRPKSKIYTPKQDDEHPDPFHMRTPPPPPSQEWLLIGGGRTCSCSVTHPVEILELAGEKWGGLDVENP